MLENKFDTSSIAYLERSLKKLEQNKPINLELINNINKKYMFAPIVLPPVGIIYDQSKIAHLRSIFSEIIDKIRQRRSNRFLSQQTPPTNPPYQKPPTNPPYQKPPTNPPYQKPPTNPPPTNPPPTNPPPTNPPPTNPPPTNPPPTNPPPTNPAPSSTPGSSTPGSSTPGSSTPVPSSTPPTTNPPTNPPTQAKSLTNIDEVILHQKIRFDELEYCLLRDPNVRVIIPGRNQVHDLGTNIAKISWDSVSYSKMKLNLDKLVEDLYKKHPSRVEFGGVGFADPSNSYANQDIYKNPSCRYIHVWGANENNWNNNLDDRIIGSGQAAAMKKQVPGVFGIVTMPCTSTRLLFELPKIYHFCSQSN